MSRSNFMPVVGVFVLVGVAGYYGFYAANTLGLENRTATATVVAKEHRPAGRSYRTDQIAGKPRVIPVATPEAYLVRLRLGGVETASLPVERELFDSLAGGDEVSVVYQQRRITGALQVVEIRRR